VEGFLSYRSHVEESILLFFRSDNPPSSFVGVGAERPHERKAHLLAGAQLRAIKESWYTASVQQQRVMVTTLLEPGGMQYAIEQERMVVLIPRSPFLSWFAQIPSVRLMHMEQGSRIVLEPSAAQLREVPASDKGRRSSKRASPEQEPVQGVLAKR